MYNTNDYQINNLINEVEELKRIVHSQDLRLKQQEKEIKQLREDVDHPERRRIRDMLGVFAPFQWKN